MTPRTNDSGADAAAHIRRSARRALTGDLAHRHLLLPVQGIRAEQLHGHLQRRRAAAGSASHEALDIMAPRNTPVLAVEDGTRRQALHQQAGRPDDLPVRSHRDLRLLLRPSGPLRATASRKATAVRRGQVLGYVGITGNAAPDAPHLHFAIFRLTPEKQWWKGDPVNPFGLLR